MSEHLQPEPKEVLDSMIAEVERPQFPEYLEWLDRRADADGGFQDRRTRDIVRGITRVSLLGLDEQAEYTDKEPALQARYWYRSLGPLNPLKEAEPDLLVAARMMYGKESPVAKESANLQLDTSYALFDLAMAATAPNRRHQALMLGLQNIHRITSKENFANQAGSYKLQTAILESDIRQALVRSKLVGTLAPTSLPAEQYHEYERVFTEHEMGAIGRFGKMVRDGITEENFGMLFEWYFVLAERHKAWDKQQIDTFIARGATSRENAEWTGEDEVDPERVTGNHDVVVSKLLPSGKTGTKRYQLKAVISENMREYLPEITVVDFKAAMKDNFRSIDGATGRMVQQLRIMQDDYRHSLREL